MITSNDIFDEKAIAKIEKSVKEVALTVDKILKNNCLEEKKKHLADIKNLKKLTRIKKKSKKPKTCRL